MMRPEDVAAVMAIERRSFSSNWPRTAFERELSRNAMARYLVLELTGEDGAVGLAGFAGLWLMLDEAHVVTVAVLPEYRGRSFGSLLVHGLLDVATAHQMSVATLECRVSNTPARQLYARYGFYEVGLRKRYYSDNQEDAVIMTTEEFDSAPYRQRLERLAQRLTARLPEAHLTVNGLEERA